MLGVKHAWRNTNDAADNPTGITEAAASFGLSLRYVSILKGNSDDVYDDVEVACNLSQRRKYDF